MSVLTVVHGDIETPEEEETMAALRAALEGHWRATRGTNDTSSWVLRGQVPREAWVVLTAARSFYSWWKISVSG